ncbi:hypothetical protein J7J00_24720 [Bacillus sp. ISL-4]|uniref:hypothetical protein n=1 Tax=Bacillus sp. ISL-4 TaxID=2819125 RepID=UPI001BE94AA3|nr:hypothetical protein [Bacillus sp. ISL-4]MBT2668637.1 hypothetical protein [Bacillus sp. ISL-4]MBT2673389.1 hypothetical protein [Streptomyces sp. ISL-14]
MLKIFSHSSFSTRKKPSNNNNNNKGSRVRNLAFALGVVLVIAFALGMLGVPIFSAYALVAGHITGAQFVSIMGLYTPIYELISESILGTLQVIPSIIPMI